MNKKYILLISLAALTFLSSCLTSLHNLVDYKNVTADDRITGDWKYGDLSTKIEALPQSSFFKSMTSTKVNGEEKKSGYDSKEDSLLYSKSYVISFIKTNYRYYMVCCLTRIGSEIYADLQPAAAEPLNKPSEEDVKNMFDAGNYQSSHSIAKLVIRNNEIEFHVLNGDYIKEKLSNGFAALRYEKDELFNSLLVTSATDELRQFLSKYGSDERLYSPKNTITLKKP